MLWQWVVKSVNELVVGNFEAMGCCNVQGNGETKWQTQGVVEIAEVMGV